MIRIDLYLVNMGYARSRTIAKRLVEANAVSVDGNTVNRASTLIDEDTDHQVTITNNIKYVSRGGYKLEGILEAGKICVEGKTCIDIGASTGGFTDCLLQKGAAHVYAIDSGTNQLDPSIAVDPRVTVLEKTNARSIDSELIPNPVDIIVMDVSFISQTLIHHTVDSFLLDDGLFISLIKPQFELSKAQIGKGGIVKSKADRHLAVKKVIESCQKHTLFPLLLTDSSIKGGDGNYEYTAIFGRSQQSDFDLIKELKKLS